VGELRWHEPVPVKPWAGVRDATAFGAMCAQNPPSLARSVSLATLAKKIVFSGMSGPQNGQHPVMVWIPGGGNLFGSTSDPRYDGESLAQRGVVLVKLLSRVVWFLFTSRIDARIASPCFGQSGNSRPDRRA
jgi:para-nitrobenzyl esterase